MLDPEEYEQKYWKREQDKKLGLSPMVEPARPRVRISDVLIALCFGAAALGLLVLGLWIAGQ